VAKTPAPGTAVETGSRVVLRLDRRVLAPEGIDGTP